MRFTRWVAVVTVALCAATIGAGGVQRADPAHAGSGGPAVLERAPALMVGAATSGAKVAFVDAAGAVLPTAPLASLVGVGAAGLGVGFGIGWYGIVPGAKWVWHDYQRVGSTGYGHVAARGERWWVSGLVTGTNMQGFDGGIGHLAYVEWLVWVENPSNAAPRPVRQGCEYSDGSSFAYWSDSTIPADTHQFSAARCLVENPSTGAYLVSGDFEDSHLTITDHQPVPDGSRRTYSCVGPNFPAQTFTENFRYEWSGNGIGNLNCPSGSHLTATQMWVTSGGNVIGDVMQWAAPQGWSDPNDPHASCMALAANPCELKPLLPNGTPGDWGNVDFATGTGPGGQPSPGCTWGPYPLTAAQCYPHLPSTADIDAVMGSWNTRRQLTPDDYTSYAPTPATEPGQESPERVVARQCLIYATKDQCTSMPIFAPGSDVYEAAKHDAVAIARQGHPPKLTFVSNAEREAGDTGHPALGRQWYQYDPICTSRGPDQDCDEYPYFSAEEGGTAAASSIGRKASLRLVNNVENRLEGRLLASTGAFATVCGLKTPPRQSPSNPDRQYLVIPLVAPDDGIEDPNGLPTMAWCRPGSKTS